MRAALALASVVLASLMLAQPHGADPAAQEQALPKIAPAPDFALPDSAGLTVSLQSYRGKVVLLDFWATWCHGCKEEIPWFSEFSRKDSRQGLAVIGVALDEEGWKVVKPFLATANVPYRIVVGDEALAKKYGIQEMPDAFLIDRQGRIAATYVGLVDRENIEANIGRMLLTR